MCVCVCVGGEEEVEYSVGCVWAGGMKESIVKNMAA